MMHVPPWCVCGLLGVMAYGVAYDVAAGAGWINGDGYDHTMPRVPAFAPAASGIQSTVSISNGAAYTAEYNTGDAYRVPPPNDAGRTMVAGPPSYNPLFLKRRDV